MAHELISYLVGLSSISSLGQGLDGIDGRNNHPSSGHDLVASGYTKQRSNCSV
jgi:hypothetical protein